MPEARSTSSPPAGSLTTEDRSFSQKDNEERQLSSASESKEDEKPAPPTQQKPAPGEGESSPRETARILAVLSSVFMCMFLVALDRTIISTAIPQITKDFNSLSDVGWYGSAYLLTCCAFQLLFGKVYTYFSVKGTFLGSLLLFEVASALCGAAPNSDAFIVGRAISGVGAAGIFSGTIVCIIHTMPLHQRPKIQGLFGALFGLASVIGPLVGGAFTSNVTWRWCFYINLPFGGVAAIFVLFLLKIPDRETTKEPLSKKLAQLDFLGTFFLVPSLVCLLLALQWGGQTYSWSNWRIILLLVLFAVLFIGFVAVQIFFPNTATLPPRIFKYRSVLAAFWMSLILGSANYILLYFIPVWFQAIKGVSSVQSGIRLLPLMLSVVLGSMLGGFTTTGIGYYNPYSIIGACIMSVGAGLIYTWTVNTSEGMWIGYQILFGFGQGISFQTPNLAVQNTLPKQDNPVGLALMLFGQLLGAAIFVSVGENVLGNQLVSRLSKFPGFSAKDVASAGAATLIDSFPKADRAAVRVQYNRALQTVFLAGLIVSCLTILGAVALEWKPIKKPGPPLQPKPSAEEGAATKEEESSQGAEKNV